MSQRTDNLRKIARGEQAKTPVARRAARRLAAWVAALAVLPAAAGCVNSNLLDPPAFFTKTAASTLKTDCEGGGKGEVPTKLQVCGDASVTTGTPITLSIFSPFSPKNGADSLAMRVTIIDPHGDIVRHIDGNRATPGYITEIWDTLDDDGAPVTSGDYRIYVAMSNESVYGDISVYR